MNHAFRTLLLVLLALLIVSPAAFADQTKKFSSKEHGFSLQYPADWYFQESSDDLQISTAENAYESEEPGAGVSIMIKEAAAADEGNHMKALTRILEDSAEGLQFGEETERTIGGRQWFAVTFIHPEKGLSGDIYVLLRGIRVFMIGRFFKQEGARDAYGEQIERLIGSFAFAERKLKQYTNQPLGISFRHPDQAKVEEKSDSIMIYVEGGNPDEDRVGAAFTLGILDAAAEGMKDLDEKGLIDMLKGMAEGEDKITIVSENEPVTVMKTTWYKSVFSMKQGLMTFIVRRYGSHFLAAVMLVSPPAAVAEYEKAFDVFLGSLAVDPKKWAASLKKRK